MENYYTLVELDQALGKWIICFGDYDLEVVRQEMKDMVEGLLKSDKGKDKEEYWDDLTDADQAREIKLLSKDHFRIIRSSDKQADIEDKVKLLNLNRLALSDDFRTRNKKLLHLVDIFQGNQDFSA
tara:strand:- start:20 stop:397 length:378 start_codon:yes stop_codon:yes gene_type:complete